MKYFFLLILVFTFAISSFAQANVPPGLIAWYTGDGNPSDFSANGLNPSESFGGTGFVVGRVGQALSFLPSPVGIGKNRPNVEAGYSVPDNDLLDFAADESFSIETWASLQSIVGTIVDKRVFVNGAYKGYVAYRSFNGTRSKNGIGCAVVIDLYGAAGVSRSVLANLGTCASGFHHYAFVMNRADDTLRVYYDGEEIGVRLDANVVGDLSNSAPFLIGKGEDNSTNGGWVGAIDELSVYSTALTPEQIASIYGAGPRGKVKDIIAPQGNNVSTRVGDLQLSFPSFGGGGISYFTEDVTALPSLPSGYTNTGLAYDVTTAAAFDSATMCFSIPSFDDPLVFQKLHIFHREPVGMEAMAWVDKTTSRDFVSKMICGTTTSFSPFAIVQSLSPTAAPIEVSGRVVSSAGRAIRGARVTLTAVNGQEYAAISNAFGYYRFENVEVSDAYTVSAKAKGYSIIPRTFSSVSDISDLDLVAE